MATSPTEQLSELPPSAKLVFYVLKQQSPLTQKGICDETLLADRTVRYALTRLDENELIEAQISFSDARQRLYSPSEVGDAVTYTEL
ncbi:MarR family transcriptional regulator [Halalkalicoccus sp. GCM10025322]|uniref:MarR family transcriptional regulator n=1 Tax=Halalkalicoccus TaxID=332246 RepID=UPI002F96E41F